MKNNYVYAISDFKPRKSIQKSILEDREKWRA